MRPVRLLAAGLAAAALVTAAPGAEARPSTAPILQRLAGQEIMTGFSGLAPSAALLQRIRAGEVGGVILFASNIGPPASLEHLIGELQAAAAAGGNPPLLVAVDQEGGAVKRLPAGPPDVSPAALGASGRSAEAAAEGKATGTYLRRLGIDVDLAPVLDTPARASSFLGTRAYSRSALLNARLGTAFLRGLQRHGVAATAKHFPGLGTARATTDSEDVVLTTSRRALDARLPPFERAIHGGVDLVMVSNAGYLAYDPAGVPAVLSRPIVTGLLRNELGFRGVVVSDAMEAPGPSSRPDPAVTAVRAGVDVLLYTSEADSAEAFQELVTAAGTGALPRSDLDAAAVRIASLKQRLAHR